MTRPTPGPAGPGGPRPASRRTRSGVAGNLDDPWAGTLGGLTLVRLADGTTSLTGPVIDQAYLHGVLVRIRDLSLRC